MERPYLERRRSKRDSGLGVYSATMRRLVGIASRVADVDSTVLIIGESGVGKERLARHIHSASPRAAGPFIPVNCGALPDALFESELFGHARGAFTGALHDRPGLFEAAHGGTLLLDEVGDVPLPMQVKLLRVLQERVFERVGNHAPIRCNVRIIAATHRNLEESIARGAFREDLFYRLNVFPIEMPALRSRLDDLPLLVRDFSDRNVDAGRSKVELTARTFKVLSAYPWPGNVRELGNLIERLSILCPNRRVDVADLPLKYRPPAVLAQMNLDAIPDELPPIEPQMHDIDELEEGGAIDDSGVIAMLTQQDPTDTFVQLPAEGLDLRDHLFTIERGLIQQALSRSGGTVAHAARLLKLRRTTLVEKLRKFQMLNEAAASEV
jgi:sigma-54 dependent transcriptional regulator, flagellar regulatory protein